MKIRYGHVSNSSSSSFVITVPIESRSMHKQFLLMIQEKIMRDDEFLLWRVEVDGNSIGCFTSMDNIELLDYCIDILGIPEAYITDRTW